MKNKQDLSDLLLETRNTFEYRLESLAQTFSDELWLAMSSRNLNQAKLARNAGLGRQFLTRIFRGKPNMTLKTMAKLAEAVGHRLCLHLAPADFSCEWIHVMKHKAQASIVVSSTAVPEAVAKKSVSPAGTKHANEELALAA